MCYETLGTHSQLVFLVSHVPRGPPSVNRCGVILFGIAVRDLHSSGALPVSGEQLFGLLFPLVVQRVGLPVPKIPATLFRKDN